MQYLKEIVLPNYPLVLSLLKHRNVWVFWKKKKKIVLLNYPLGLPLLNIGMCGYFGTKKKSGSNRCNPLNSSIDIDDEKLELKKEVGIHLEKKKPHRIYFFIKISIAKFGA